MDRTDITLQAVIRALTDVVAPALDPDSALAGEQLRLSIDHLRFIATRIDRLYDRDLFELQHHIRLAEAVRAALPTEPDRVERLDAAVTAGATALTSAGTPPLALREASAAVAAAISAIIRDLGDVAPAVRQAVVSTVVAGSAERVAFERSWYAPLGIDPDRDELPSLEQLLDTAS